MENENDPVEVIVNVVRLMTDATGESVIFEKGDKFETTRERAIKFGNSVTIIEPEPEPEPEPSQELVTDEAPPLESLVEPDKPKNEVLEEDEDTPTEEWTVTQIKGWLSANGVEYPHNVVKAELLELAENTV